MELKVLKNIDLIPINSQYFICLNNLLKYNFNNNILRYMEIHADINFEINVFY